MFKAGIGEETQDPKENGEKKSGDESAPITLFTPNLFGIL